MITNKDQIAISTLSKEERDFVLTYFLSRGFVWHKSTNPVMELERINSIHPFSSYPCIVVSFYDSHDKRNELYKNSISGHQNCYATISFGKFLKRIKVPYDKI